MDHPYPPPPPPPPPPTPQTFSLSSRVFPVHLSRTNNPDEQSALRARQAEYQAIWQLFNRCAAKDVYRNASVPTRKLMLKDAVQTLLDKRRRQGRPMCNANIDELIGRQMKRERSRQYKRELEDGAMDPAKVEGDLPAGSLDNGGEVDVDDDDDDQPPLLIDPILHPSFDGLPYQVMDHHPPPRFDNPPPPSYNPEGPPAYHHHLPAEPVLRIRPDPSLARFSRPRRPGPPPPPLPPPPPPGTAAAAPLSALAVPDIMRPHLHALEAQVAEQLQVLRDENDALQRDNRILRRDVAVQSHNLMQLNHRVRDQGAYMLAMKQYIDSEMPKLHRVIKSLLAAVKRPEHAAPRQAPKQPETPNRESGGPMELGESTAGEGEGREVEGDES